MEFGGARRDRTADLLHVMYVLFRLNYSLTDGDYLRVTIFPIAPFNISTLFYEDNVVKKVNPNYVLIEICGRIVS